MEKSSLQQSFKIKPDFKAEYVRRTVGNLRWKILEKLDYYPNQDEPEPKRKELGHGIGIFLRQIILID